MQIRDAFWGPLFSGTTRRYGSASHFSTSGLGISACRGAWSQAVALRAQRLGGLLETSSLVRLQCGKKQQQGALQGLRACRKYMFGRKIDTLEARRVEDRAANLFSGF